MCPSMTVDPTAAPGFALCFHQPTREMSSGICSTPCHAVHRVDMGRNVQGRQVQDRWVAHLRCRRKQPFADARAGARTDGSGGGGRRCCPPPCRRRGGGRRRFGGRGRRHCSGCFCVSRRGSALDDVDSAPALVGVGTLRNSSVPAMTSNTSPIVMTGQNPATPLRRNLICHCCCLRLGTCTGLLGGEVSVRPVRRVVGAPKPPVPRSARPPTSSTSVPVSPWTALTGSTG